MRIEVLCSCVLSKIKVRYVRKDAFHAQVERRDSWQLGHVNATSETRLSRIGNRGKLIFRERISVERQPVPHARQAVREVECRSAVRRVIGSARSAIGAWLIAAQEIVQGKREPRAAEEDCQPEPKFEIAGGFKGKLLTVQIG